MTGFGCVYGTYDEFPKGLEDCLKKVFSLKGEPYFATHTVDPRFTVDPRSPGEGKSVHYIAIYYRYEVAGT